jgi:hypothetical protein
VILAWLPTLREFDFSAFELSTVVSDRSVGAVTCVDRTIKAGWTYEIRSPFWLVAAGRAVDATRGQIRVQFLAESLLLSALGGAGRLLLGVGVTAGYTVSQGWPTAVPGWVRATFELGRTCFGALVRWSPPTVRRRR